MRAMLLRAAAPIEACPLAEVDRPVPEPGPGQILVRVAACGICRTDLHLVEGDLPLVRSPVVPGHQVVGRVERAGPGVRVPRSGERVGIAWLRHACGVCAFCLSGRENLCERAEFTGYHADGGYAEWVVAAAEFVYRIPETFGDVEAAPLLCAGIIGYRALTLTGVAPGGRLALYGFGSSAHITLQVARARGLEVYVGTRGVANRELARALGAAWAGAPAEPLPAPADGAIIFAPAGDLVPIALRQLAPGGTLTLAGIHMSTIPALPYADLSRERTLRSVANSTREDGRGLLQEAAAIPLRPAVTTFGLGEANRALARLKQGGLTGSGVLVPDRVS
jgi:propanol-preferring alcohol dehydrogenase